MEKVVHKSNPTKERTTVLRKEAVRNRITIANAESLSPEDTIQHWKNLRVKEILHRTNEWASIQERDPE